MEDYPDTANEIKAWVGIIEAVRWHNFAEVRGMFKDADLVDGYVIFNIRQNRYRLITVVHCAKTTEGKQTEGHVNIRSFLTHKEYDEDGSVLHGHQNSGDIGMAQINAPLWEAKAINLGFDIYTAEGNLGMAKWIFDHYGSQPWFWSEHCWGAKKYGGPV